MIEFIVVRLLKSPEFHRAVLGSSFPNRNRSERGDTAAYKIICTTKDG